MNPPGLENAIDLSLDEGLLIHILLKKGAMSRTDLARELDCSRAKSGELVNALIERGLLAEVNNDSRTRSRLVNLDPDFGYIAGIDVGTTSLDVGVSDMTGEVIARYSTESAVEDGPDIVLGEAIAFINGVLEQEGVGVEKLRSIGIGLPGPVRFPSFSVIGDHFLPGWEGHEVHYLLQPAFPKAVIVVDNDANIMALGSQHKGLGKDYQNFIFVKVGTGIGAGVIINGKLLRGATSCAGHIGHTCVDFSGPYCRCGNQGCLEAMAGGPAIARKAMQAVADGESDLLAEYMEQNNGVLTAVDVGEAAAKGDETSLGIFRDAGRMIGYVLAGVANVVNPEIIVVGGGVSKSGYQMLTAVRRAILKRSYPFVTVNLPVRYSPIIDDVGVYGCIALASDWLFRVEGESLEALC